MSDSLKKGGSLCDKCGLVCKSPTILASHKSRHHPGKIYNCLVCGKHFKNCSSLCHHKKIHGNSKRHECDVCHQRFRDKSALATHKNSHLPLEQKDRTFQCDLCSAAFSYKRSLLHHQYAAHGVCSVIGPNGKPIIRDRRATVWCDVCGKEFGTSSMARHKRTHNNDKPHACKTCGKSFIQSNNLKAHENTHTGEKNYVCDICGKGFHQKSNLNSHKKKNSCNKKKK